MIRISKSKALTFMNCPLQYKLQYILDIPCPPNFYMIRGKEIHDDVNKFFDMFNPLDIGNPVTQFNRIIRNIANDRFIKYQEFYESFLNYEIWRWTEMLNAFRGDKSQMKLFFKPYMREEKIEIRENGNEIVGILDRVDYVPNVGYVILDYKTGNVGSIKDYLFELGIYVYLFRKKFKKDVMKVGIIGLKNRKLFLKNVSDDMVNNSMRELNKIIKSIENEDFRCKLGKHCRWCPNNYRKICYDLGGYGRKKR